MMTDKSLVLFAEILCVCKAALIVNIKSRAKVVPMMAGCMTFVGKLSLISSPF